MRIAFVGKGGSGKSTLSSIFSLYLKSISERPILVFDADINIHVPELLFGEKIKSINYLSNNDNKYKIFDWLLDNETGINSKDLKKTSTPTSRSNLISEKTLEASFLNTLGIKRDNLNVFAVGTYEDDSIGTSCYHNNLSVLETILNYIDDKEIFVVTDMVAGIDSFAGTMHAQFDMVVLIVEPTKRSLEVWQQYLHLAKEAGVSESLYVLGNKIQNQEDVDFLKQNLPAEKLLGMFENDEYLRDLDKTGEVLDFMKINNFNKETIYNIFTKFNSLSDSRNVRLEKIRQLHKKYVSQGYVIRAHGDLTDQIDTNFKFI